MLSGKQRSATWNDNTIYKRWNLLDFRTTPNINYAWSRMYVCLFNISAAIAKKGLWELCFTEYKQRSWLVSILIVSIAKSRVKDYMLIKAKRG